MSTAIIVPSSGPRHLWGYGIVLLCTLVAAVVAMQPCRAHDGAAAPPSPRNLLVVDVNAAMDGGGVWRDSVFGGVALEPDRYGPARIFRFGPSDRDRGSFYLEDPTSPTSCWGSMPLRLSPPVAPWVDALRYDIDGDLRVDNHHTLMLFLDAPETLQQVTIRVHGDVYIADDLRAPAGKLRIEAYPRTTGVGGHIFLGDARFGTLDIVEAELVGDVRAAPTAP